MIWVKKPKWSHRGSVLGTGDPTGVVYIGIDVAGGCNLVVCKVGVIGVKKNKN